jgi:hydroxysqualene dehydroxylase
MTTAARPRAFVLGGGVAGLTAAFGLADRGYAVRLLESRGWLGGRAFSSPDKSSGRELDNGPHVLLGCYRGMAALLRRVGTLDGVQRDRTLRLAFRSVDARTVRLVLGRAPVPLAMPWALLRLRLPFGDRWRALRGMLTVLRRAPADWSLATWLRERRQHGAPEAYLWRPLCRAIMNVEPEAAAAEDFLVTLREAFAGSAAKAAFWLPKQPLRALLGDPAAKALAAAGAEVTTGARIAGFDVHASRITGLVLGDGARVEVEAGDVVVSALPWLALHALLPTATPPFGTLQSSPIVSAFCELPPTAAVAAAPDADPVMALVGGEPFHFLLRRPGDDVRRFALLSGGDRSFDGQTVETIAARARAQLQRYWPRIDLADASVRVRKEQHATFVAACGSSASRPRPGRLPDGPSNLLVCGDWTATGLPATLEGAARSATTMLAALNPA